METTTGSLGFTIPIQNLPASQEVNMTPADITAWRNHLPMADLGSAAKKIYHAITDCNKVKLELKDRFEILELFRTPVQFTCQSLRKHYINSTANLTEQQLTIANLAETLQIEMANGYKLIVEELERANSPELRTRILPIALQRIIHYFTYIIHRNYQLYSTAPKGIWKELHLVYTHAEKNQLLKQNNILNDYKRVLLLSATDPYQWRQSEQDALYNATEAWASLINLQDNLPNISNAGFLVIDFNDDTPPLAPARGVIQFSSSCKAMDVNPVLNHLKTLLTIIEPNELQARMAHTGDPEYSLSSSILKRIIKQWGTPRVRMDERKACSEQIKLSIGLIATHYYINNQRPFQTQSLNKTENTGENVEAVVTNIELDKIPIYSPGSEKPSTYPSYACQMINESANGFGLIWSGNNYPPVQAGEIAGIEREQNGARSWEICVIRWLKHQSKNEFRIGLESLAKTTKAGSIQLLKEGKPAGYSLRCLLLESTLLTPILPFKSGSQAMVILQDDPHPPLELELTKLIDATGSYKQFQFVAKNAPIKEIHMPSSSPSNTLQNIDMPKKEGSIPVTEKRKDEEKGKDKFDSIWSKL